MIEESPKDLHRVIFKGEGRAMEKLHEVEVLIELSERRDRRV